MAYADFTYYVTSFFGTAIAESDFPQLAMRASAEIDRITFGRAADEIGGANTAAIQNAMCAVAEELQSQDSSDGVDGITSESQGQYSVTYAENSSRSLSNFAQLQSAASLWLANTGLMFAGFSSGEYGWTVDDS